MDVKIAALLSWYSEQPDWLAETVTSLERAGVTDLVAVDGAYSLFPGAAARSSDEEHDAIRTAAADAGISVSIVAPNAPWSSEIDKRNHMFEAAEDRAADWYFVIDGDERVVDAPADLHERLRSSVFDVAQVTLAEPHPLKAPNRIPFPMFFRAIPGLRVVANHYTYVTPDRRVLWGNASRVRLAPRLDVTDMTVVHLTHFRESARRLWARDYYATRDRSGVETDYTMHARPREVAL